MKISLRTQQLKTIFFLRKKYRLSKTEPLEFVPISLYNARGKRNQLFPRVYPHHGILPDTR